MDRPAFVAALGGVFEHSAWVAERAWDARPFRTLEKLHAAMTQVAREADPAARLGLLRAHPELAGGEALAGNMTAHSTTEQGRLGLDALRPEELKRMSRLNRLYRSRFGFPCIIALRLHADRASVFGAMEGRLSRTQDCEERAALQQVAHITLGRLKGLVTED